MFGYNILILNIRESSINRCCLIFFDHETPGVHDVFQSIFVICDTCGSLMGIPLVSDITFDPQPPDLLVKNFLNRTVGNIMVINIFCCNFSCLTIFGGYHQIIIVCFFCKHCFDFLYGHTTYIDPVDRGAFEEFLFMLITIIQINTKGNCQNTYQRQ